MKGISNTFLQKGALPSLDGWLPDMTTPYSGSDRKADISGRQALPHKIRGGTHPI